MKERYIIIKRIYNDYLILIKKNKIFITYNEDKLIYYTFGLKNLNYIILNNLDIEEKIEVSNNKYIEYYVKIKLIEVLKEKIKNEKEDIVL